MSYYRSYFSKNNTIIKNSLINTSKNPTTEIFYGNGHSKFIFQVDLSGLQAKVNNGDLVVNSDTKHYLHMTNTIFGSESFVGQLKGTGGSRATSFDLTLFPLDEFWDEGVGFDYEVPTVEISYDNKTIDTRPSNWYFRTTLSGWTTDGIYNTIPTGVTATTIHFDNGNEDIHVDITEYINGLLLSGNTNYGMVISFDIPYFDINDSKQSVSFFSKYTQTFFEPYVESVFNDIIDDNREDFVIDAERNLYLYVTKNGNYYDLDELPLVSILDSTSSVFDETLTGMTATKVRKGIYKITFGLTGFLCDGKRFFYDKWSNIVIDGILLNDVKQKFVPKLFSQIYSIGLSSSNGGEYVIKYSGVKTNEKIKRGENRRISVSLKSVNTTKTILSNELYYRIYVKEGKTQVNVFDWTKLDKINENSFMLDTSYLIPREYYLVIKGNINSEEIFYNNEIKFEIVSEK